MANGEQEDWNIEIARTNIELVNMFQYGRNKSNK